MTKNDGGPAFPHDGQANYTGGMSLRDWFAGQALQGIIAGREGAIIDIVADAYIFADAMLKERKNDGKEK